MISETALKLLGIVTFAGIVISSLSSLTETECDKLHHERMSAGKIYMQLADEQNQIKLDVETGRRGDHNAAWQEIADLQARINTEIGKLNKLGDEQNAKACKAAK